MDADFSVELAADDESLEYPWAAPDASSRYYDLKRHPELLAELEEVQRLPELGAFLAAINAPDSPTESAKCDLWATDELNPEEDIYEAAWKFGSYVDLVFSDAEARFSFDVHEGYLKRIIGDLSKTPEMSAAAEFLLRRCYYHMDQEIRAGFYITFYLFGYGDDENSARKNWTSALVMVRKVLATTCNTKSQPPRTQRNTEENL
jgi:hypothetical protein